MNSKNLIIAFVAVSIAALIVSSLAVFTVARTYGIETAAGEDEIPIAPETESSPDETESLPTVIIPPPSDTQTETDTEAMTENTDLPGSTASEQTSETAAETSSLPTAHILKLSGSRLVIFSPEGQTVYERITDPSDMHKKDREALLTGIAFPDLESAMSAVYDIIS